MTFMSQTIAEKTQPGQRQSIEESSKTSDLPTLDAPVVDAPSIIHADDVPLLQTDLIFS